MNGTGIFLKKIPHIETQRRLPAKPGDIVSLGLPSKLADRPDQKPVPLRACHYRAAAADPDHPVHTVHPAVFQRMRILFAQAALFQIRRYHLIVGRMYHFSDRFRAVLDHHSAEGKTFRRLFRQNINVRAQIQNKHVRVRGLLHNLNDSSDLFQRHSLQHLHVMQFISCTVS